MNHVQRVRRHTNLTNAIDMADLTKLFEETTGERLILEDLYETKETNQWTR